MALTFPSSPTANQVYTDATTGNRYIYDSTKGLWKFSSNNVGMTVSSTPPGGVAAGATWFNSSIGRTFVYYDDGDSQQWVETVPAGTVDTNTIAGYVNPVFALTNGSYTTANAAYNTANTFSGVYGVANAAYNQDNVVFGVANAAFGKANNALANTNGVTFAGDLNMTGNVISLGTGSITLPIGTTAQRPGTATNGMTRFNTTLGGIDFYDGNAWNNIPGTGAADPYYSQTKLIVKNSSLTDASYVRRTLTNSGAAIGYTTYPNITKFPSGPNSLTGGPGYTWQINQSTGCYVNVGGTLSHFDLSQAAWTLEYWIYVAGPQGGTPYCHTFYCGGQTAGGTFKMWASDYKPYLYSNAGQSVGASVSIGGSNVWAWVVFERYNNVVSCWINGGNRAQGTTMPTGGTPGQVAVGLQNASEYASHYIDELRFTTAARYQGALTIPIQTASWPEH